MLLNGQLLELLAAAKLPALHSLARSGVGEGVVVPPQSYGFVVYTAAQAPACM